MTELDRLLMRVRDGDASPATLARARALIAVDERLPPDLRAFGLSDDEPAVDAAAFLGVLGLDGGLLGGLLAEALADEADAGLRGAPARSRETPHPQEITAAILAAQEAEGLPPVADAVRYEAGELDISVAVCVRMGHLPAPVGEAVAAEAGEVDLALPSFALLPVGEAVRDEAGEADVASAVFAKLSFESGIAVRDAVAGLAGRVDLVDVVLARLPFTRAPEVLGDPEAVALRAPIAEAVRAESGDVDLALSVLESLGTPAVPVAAAVREEAGEHDAWSNLAPAFAVGWASALYDRELSLAAHKVAASRLRERGAALQLTAWAEIGAALRERVAAEAGPISAWTAVAARIGIEDAERVPGYQGLEVANAVRAQAGRVDVTRAVSGKVRPVPSAEPANNTWAWMRYAVVGLAAAAVLALSIGRVIPMLGPSASTVDGVALAPDFATGDEIRVEDLSWAADSHVQVIQSHDDAGQQALIIWIDEEA